MPPPPARPGTVRRGPVLNRLYHPSVNLGCCSVPPSTQDHHLTPPALHSPSFIPSSHAVYICSGWIPVPKFSRPVRVACTCAHVQIRFGRFSVLPVLPGSHGGSAPHALHAFRRALQHKRCTVRITLARDFVQIKCWGGGLDAVLTENTNAPSNGRR